MGNHIEHRDVISDYDFVKEISDQLADYYKKAMSFYVSECYPDALTNYRKGLSVMITLTSEALGFKYEPSLKDLEERIKNLANSARIHQNMTTLMHQIRKAGNKGTHSEEYPTENFHQLTVDTQDKFLKLLKKLYLLISKGKKPSDYECTLKDELNIATLSHKALFENDSNAQYFVAKKLNMNAQQILLDNSYGDVNRCAEVELPNGDIERRYHNIESSKDISIAYQLFKACQLDNPEALYEIGKIQLTNGHWLDDKVDNSEAVMNIQRASLWEIVEASSLLGRIYLHGLYGEELNVELGLEVLQEAAEQGEPKAIFELANYYFEQKNNELALKYLSLAADDGSPKAQFLLAKYLMDGLLTANKAIDIDLLLTEAWNAGVHKARLYQARRLSLKSGEIYCDEAQSFYEEYVRKQPSARELLECAQYLIKFNQPTLKAQQYLYSALQLSQQTGDHTLNTFLSYIFENMKVFFNNDSQGAMEIEFPQEVLQQPEQLDINERLIKNALLDKPKLTKPPGKLRRNDPCYCGSGKKYKNCHIHLP